MVLKMKPPPWRHRGEAERVSVLCTFAIFAGPW
jgi:hypothetical protein